MESKASSYPSNFNSSELTTPLAFQHSVSMFKSFFYEDDYEKANELLMFIQNNIPLGQVYDEENNNETLSPESS